MKSAGYRMSVLYKFLIFLSPIFLLSVTQVCGQGVEVSTAADTKKERKMKVISDVKFPIEGTLSDYEKPAILHGKDGYELNVARKDAKEKSRYNYKGELLRKEVKTPKTEITISNEEEAPNFVALIPDMPSPKKLVEFPNGKKVREPAGHDLVVSPNGKYLFSFPGSEVNEKDWYIRLYNDNGKVLWEYFDVFCPDSDADPSHIEDFPVLWSPDGNFLAFVIERKPEKICLFSAKGFEWSYKSQDGHPVGITIAKSGTKVMFGIRQRRTLQERMVTKEMQEKGFDAWTPSVPVSGSCLDKNGKFLWKKEFMPASLHFSEDGRFFFTIRTTEEGGKIQIVDADNGDLIHEQILKDWYEFAEKGRIQDLTLDVEKKNLAILIEEKSVEGIEWHEFMGGTYLKRTGPTKRHDLGYRLVVYDLSGIPVK